MATGCKVGTIALTTGGAGTTFVESSFGFTPKGVLFWWMGRNDGSDAIGTHTTMNAFQGFGIAQSASSRYCVGQRSARISSRDDAVHVQHSTLGTVNGRIDLQSLDADGLTLVVDDDVSALRLHYLAIGGDDVTNVACGRFDIATSTGDQDVTGVGFQPDAVIFLFPNLQNLPGSVFESFMHIGFAAGATPENLVWAAYANVGSYCRLGESIAYVDTSSNVGDRGRVTSWLSDGFRINWTELDAIAGRDCLYMALKGGQYKVGSFSTRTDGNDITVTPGFEARGVVLVSACRAESTADADTSDGEISFGAFTSASARVGTTLFHDGTDSQSAVEYDEAYVHIDTTPALVALGDVTAIGASTFTMVMDNPDDAANFVGYFAVGDNVETSKPWLHYAHLMRS